MGIRLSNKTYQGLTLDVGRRINKDFAARPPAELNDEITRESTVCQPRIRAGRAGKKQGQRPATNEE
jgi:hypothetical protein